MNSDSVELCDWHEVCIPLKSFTNPEAEDLFQNLGKLEPGNLLPSGIWTLADVLEYGKDKGICPYFAVRRMVSIVAVRLFRSSSCWFTQDAVCGCDHLFFPLSA